MVDILSYMEIELIALVLSLIVYINIKGKKIQLFESLRFERIIVMNMILIVLDTFTWLNQTDIFPHSPVFSHVIMSVYFIFQTAMPLLLLQYCISFYRRIPTLRHMLIAVAPLVTVLLIIIINFFIPIAFIITSDNSYYRLGGFYVISFMSLLYLVACVIMAVSKYLRVKKSRKADYRRVVIFTTVPLLTAIFGTLVKGSVIWPIISLDVAYVYLTVYSNRIKELEEELEDSRISVMISQIQPHFLYNSLTAIQGMCVENPTGAKNALGAFSKYLRANMDSLSSKELLYFEKELEHVKNYLYLEQIRFDDYLKIEYIINETDFFLPALTIQPLVENAVKYGVGEKKEGGTVTISSWSDDEYFYVSVEDDGVGASTNNLSDLEKKNDGRSHIGLSSVRSRIELLCNGKIEFESIKDVGTKVTIIIPRTSK